MLMVMIVMFGRAVVVLMAMFDFGFFAMFTTLFNLAFAATVGFLITSLFLHTIVFIIPGIILHFLVVSLLVTARIDAFEM